MIKFNRQSVVKHILSNVDVEMLFEKRLMTVTLAITGKLYNGTAFQGNTTIRIILPYGLCKIFPI